MNKHEREGSYAPEGLSYYVRDLQRLRQLQSRNQLSQINQINQINPPAHQNLSTYLPRVGFEARPHFRTAPGCSTGRPYNLLTPSTVRQRCAILEDSNGVDAAFIAPAFVPLLL
jgi:hypothetical protein